MVVLKQLNEETLLNYVQELENNLIELIRRKLCIVRQPISGLLRYNIIHHWSKFCKGVKQGIQLACIWCPNA